MNKEQAINILLQHAIRSIDPKNGAYGAEIDEITAAILFLERDRDKNKVDTKVEIKGTSFSIKKGI